MKSLKKKYQSSEVFTLFNGGTSCDEDAAGRDQRDKKEKQKKDAQQEESGKRKKEKQIRGIRNKNFL